MINKELSTTNTKKSRPAKTEISKDEVLHDYKLAFLSRQISHIGRKEVHSGKAKFGIFGDGKEVAQIAYAKFFRKGDWRAGYYRDQTFMLAAGLLTPEEFFAQLYGSTDEALNPSTAGRNFNKHFATRNFHNNKLDNLTNQKNSSSDISSTSGQMPRLLGLAHASKLFRNVEYLWQYQHFSNFGNEVAFGTIGDASTSEGQFFETINAACVMQVPLAIAVWDDGFGISVPVELQTTKASISKALKGFEKEGDSTGCLIYNSKGWDYLHLIKTFRDGIEKCRKDHVPVVFHVQEMTQPFGHSSSGSHERYKSPERLQWEIDFDPITKMKEWILQEKIADQTTIQNIESEAIAEAKTARHKAWESYIRPYLKQREELFEFVQNFPSQDIEYIKKMPEFSALSNNPYPSHKDVLSFAKKIAFRFSSHTSQVSKQLNNWISDYQKKTKTLYNTKLYAHDYTSKNTLPEIKPVYKSDASLVNGREILNRNFDYLFQKYPLLLTFGEDTGKLGDVNQSLRGMQQKYGIHKVSDTGIREATIIGQGIGLAMRGFRPIAEIQYFDYLVYALQTLTDDLATLHYRTNGRQIAPLIIRTRGHRLVGIWHSGSPMGMIINSLRGVNVCVPRNMTQAAGFYNSLLEMNDPALVIEPLKGYDLHEYLPDNIGEFKVPLGVPEIITQGTDITIVTYGWCVEIAKEAMVRLSETGISVELIDIQTLLPFDTNHVIIQSLMKTNRILFLDEDVPGGASSYMMQKVLEEQGGYAYLDSPPKTLTAKEHRPAYDTDGDYFSKPNAEDVFESVYQIMQETNPRKFNINIPS